MSGWPRSRLCMVGMPSGRGTGSPERADKPPPSTRRNGSLRATSGHSSTTCGGNSTTCEAPQRKPLQSLLRQGLEVFVDSRADGQQPCRARPARRGRWAQALVRLVQRGRRATGRAALLHVRSNWLASRRTTGSAIICKPAPNMTDERPKGRMPGFPGVPTRSASAPGAPRLRRGHELCGRDFSEDELDLIRDRATEPASQTHAPVTRANASTGASPTAASKT